VVSAHDGSRSEAVRGELVGGLKAGLSVADAARRAGVAERTVRHWLTRGRREPDGRYASFAAEVDAALSAVPSGPLAEGELREAVARAVREGSVPAMRLAWQMERDAATDAKGGEGDAFDELAERRQRAIADGA
jgi:predicted transcriptional regulator